MPDSLIRGGLIACFKQLREEAACLRVSKACMRGPLGALCIVTKVHISCAERCHAVHFLYRAALHS
jgi:hypothetical protein